MAPHIICESGAYHHQRTEIIREMIAQTVNAESDTNSKKNNTLRRSRLNNLIQRFIDICPV